MIRAEIGGWTRDGIVRQTAYKGIDEGHDPKAVTRERPVPSAKAAAEAEKRIPEEPHAGRRRRRDRNDEVDPAELGSRADIRRGDER